MNLDPKSPNGFRKNHLNQTDQTFKVPENLHFFRVYHTKPLTHPPEFSPKKHTNPTSTSWWLNQPIWKIWVKIGSSFPIFGVKIPKYLSCHHQHPKLPLFCFLPKSPMFRSPLLRSIIDPWASRNLLDEATVMGPHDEPQGVVLCWFKRWLVQSWLIWDPFFVNKTNQPTFKNTLEDIWIKQESYDLNKW